MKLVLLPGLDGTGRLFDPLIQVLPAQLSPIVISYPTEQPLSYQDLLRFVRSRVPSDEDYVLLAESFSGPLAIELAAKQGKNLKALILCSTFVTNPVLVPRIMSGLACRIAFVLGPPQFFVSRYLPGGEATSRFG